MAASVSCLKALPLADSQSNNSTDKSETVATTTQQTLTTTGESGNSTTTTEPPGDSTAIDFTSYQDTSTFTCNKRVTGYYADVKLDCRIYHFCTQMDGIDGPTYQRMSYLCLEDSYFDQGDLNCVKHSDMKVPCDQAEKEYERSNKQFDPKEDSQPSMSDNLAANIMMNPITRFIAGR
jgi:hypothetical protein